MIKDEMIAKAADVLAIRRHNYDVNADTWRPYCICGWTAEEPFDVASYDRHLAELVIEAILPDIIQQAWNGTHVSASTGTHAAIVAHRLTDLSREDH